MPTLSCRIDWRSCDFDKGRAVLKDNGFQWSPKTRRWTRQATRQEAEAIKATLKRHGLWVVEI